MSFYHISGIRSSGTYKFYFRFIAPYHDELTYRPERVLPRMGEELRALVGATAVEELSRQWVTVRGRAGQLPFEIQEIGSHWNRGTQVDVVALNWTECAILLGEYKWGTDAVGENVIRTA